MLKIIKTIKLARWKKSKTLRKEDVRRKKNYYSYCINNGKKFIEKKKSITIIKK